MALVLDGIGPARFREFGGRTRAAARRLQRAAIVPLLPW
jgi:hypothetical protein